MEGAFDCIRHMDVERALPHKGVHPASICENLVISRVELIYQEPRCRLPFHMLVVLDKAALKDLICGIRVLDDALREPAARWESEKIGFKMTADYCRLRKVSPFFS